MEKNIIDGKKVAKLYTKDMFTQQKIANLFGTTQKNIQRILQKENVNCAEIYKKRRENTWTYVVCSACGTSLKKRKCNIVNNKNYFCSKKCESKYNNFGENVELRGSYTDCGGYKYYKINGKYMAEHRIIVERNIKRPLKSWEFVHHLNGIRKDNRIENLVIVTNKTHESGTFRKLLQKRIIELEEQLEKNNTT